MAWCGIHGHDVIADRFRRALERGRLASTFLFVGPEGIGKRTFAHRLAQALLCDRHDEQEMIACQSCASCQQVQAQSHPDFEVVRCPPDRSAIPLDLLVGDREHRMRAGLCHRIALRPARGRRKVAIIEDADLLHEEGANALLKTLEEPPPGSVLILIGTSEQRQLPTIRSRCQAVRFAPLPVPLVQQLIGEQKIVPSPDLAAEAAAWSEGSLEGARRWADPDLHQFRRQLFDALSQPAIDGLHLAQWVSEFVEQAGQPLSARRDRLRQVLQLFVHFFRSDLARRLNATPAHAAGPSASNQPVPITHGQRPIQTFQRRQLVDQLDRCLVAWGQLEANANPTTLIDAWMDDLFPPPSATRPTSV